MLKVPHLPCLAVAATLFALLFGGMQPLHAAELQRAFVCLDENTDLAVFVREDQLSSVKNMRCMPIEYRKAILSGLWRCDTPKGVAYVSAVESIPIRNGCEEVKERVP
jgi:hypothetical protein